MAHEEEFRKHVVNVYGGDYLSAPTFEEFSNHVDNVKGTARATKTSRSKDNEDIYYEEDHFPLPSQRDDYSKLHSSEKIAERLLRELKENGIYLYHIGKARRGGNPSVYLKFEDSRIGSIRIGDHEGIKKYSYRWNIEVNSHEIFDKFQGHKRFFYGEYRLQEFLRHIVNYINKID